MCWLVLMLVGLTPLEAFQGQDSQATSSAPMALGAKESHFTPGSVPPSTTLEYIVSPEDLLDIEVFEVPEISRSYRVTPTGLVSLPLLLEPISAAGLSPAQLSQVIARKFREAGLLSNPQVTVSVKETRLHSVVVAGAVKKPQVYPVFGPTRLLQVLSQAGGLADDAGDNARINRGVIGRGVGEQAGSGPAGALGPSVSVDVRKLLEGGDESLDLILYPGDRVTVEQTGIVYVIGAVSRPGGYPLKDPQEEMTVLKALALAGDVTNSAKRDKVLIMRKKAQASGEREEVRIDLRKIIAGRSPDQRLRGDDILFVPESGKLKAMRQAVGAGVGMGTAITTGIVIYRH